MARNFIIFTTLNLLYISLTLGLSFHNTGKLHTKGDLGDFTPDWDSLNNRTLPQWYDDAKFGIMFHWGIYSVPSFESEWFWELWKDEDDPDPDIIDFMKANYPPNFTYQDFGPLFRAQFFNADHWAQIVQQAGAKYVVITTKHHDGFTLWPSKYSFSWNSNDTGPNQDLIGKLASAMKGRNITFGIYHSLLEWFNPLYVEDKTNKWTTNLFAQHKALPELYELVNLYEPEIIWSDGEWEAPDWYWNSTIFLAWLYNKSPVRETVVVNDRWGSNTQKKAGDFWNGPDDWNPGVLQPHKWENAMSIDYYSYGYDRLSTLSDIRNMSTLIYNLVSTVSCGGNFLLNIGPTAYGTLPSLFEERLLQLGAWLKINGEAIYKTKPWSRQQDELNLDVWYVTRPDLNATYLINLNWPQTNNVTAKYYPELYSSTVKIQTLGVSGNLEWTSNVTAVNITLPNFTDVKNDWAWVLKFTG